MRVAVYLPLVLPILGTISARWLAERLDPRVATWLLTIAAVGLAAASGAALAALAATGLGQIPQAAALGDWSAAVLRRDDPASVSLALAASVLLAAAITNAARLVIHRVLTLVHVVRAAPRLPRGSDMAVLEEPAPTAYAVPGWPGRIVVSTGMLQALDSREQQALLAHERAHLDCGHHLFVALTEFAAATNPLLRPLATGVRYTVERWADEHAAGSTDDRRLVARTIGKAALLTKHHPMRAAGMPIVRDGRRGGPVPRRVAAMLAAPLPQRRLILAVSLTVVVIAIACIFDATRELHMFFELAEIGSH